MTHTPGPWHCDAIWMQGGYLETADAASLSPPASEYEEAMANARLIAAAPDMLAALRAAWTYACVRDTSVLAPIVLAAIAKAEGK